MLRRLGLVMFALAAPAALQAQEPERLLPAGTQIYLRWDGLEAHRPAFDETALGKVLQDDTGRFIGAVFGQLQDSLQTLLTAQHVLGGAPPERLQQVQADAAAAVKLPRQLLERGFALGVEVRSLEPPQGQVVLILPGAGKSPEPLFGTLRLLASLADLPVKQAKASGRAVFHLEAGPLHVVFWVEGPDAVLVAGTERPEQAVRRLAKGGLSDRPLYQRVRRFKGFQTAARGFVDVAALFELASSRGPEVRRLLEVLGLDGLRSAVFYSGFDGRYGRSLTELDMPGPRKGLLRLAGGQPFTLRDVPPLPPDVVSWSMTNLDLAALYDTAVQAAEPLARLAGEKDGAEVKELVQQADALLGVNLRQDLVGNLAGRVVAYNSPGEGFSFFGQTVLFQVKDADRLQEALDRSVRSLFKASGVNGSLETRKYRGTEVRLVEVREAGFPLLPTYAVHKGWLAVGFYPQAVQGYVARAEGALSSWQPGQDVETTLKQMPREFQAIAISDPRPTVTQLLTIVPMVARVLASTLPDVKLDVGLLPNAQSVTRHLFPNVSIVTDDGQVLRLHTRASLPVPAGLDAYSSVFVFAALFAFAG